MKPTLITIALTLALIACATVKSVARTINDAADIACEIFGADHPDALQGLTPQQWCDVKSNIDPFLDEILAAQQRAGATLGVTSGGEAQ